jgi:hypothetical protein
MLILTKCDLDMRKVKITFCTFNISAMKFQFPFIGSKDTDENLLTDKLTDVPTLGVSVLFLASIHINQ